MTPSPACWRHCRGTLGNPSFDILWPAFLAGLLIVSTHVPLGRLVLERGIVFIDLAIAQVAGLGVVIADALGFAPHGAAVQLSAGAAAVLGAGFLVWTERHAGDVQEAIIGVVFVLAASLEIVVLSFNPHGSEHLKDLLVGQILWVDPRELVPVLPIYLGILGAYLLADLRRRRVLFYLLFAVAITASVQLVGIFLVFSSLILPALAGHRMRVALRMPVGYAVGVVGYVIGLGVSAVVDVPSGAAIVCALAAVAAAVACLAPTQAAK